MIKLYEDSLTTDYVHPKTYAGIINTPNNQAIQRAFVEVNCLWCEEFCGREHDFSNCITRNKDGQRVRMCRSWAKEVSLVSPGMEVRCRVEG